MDAGQFFYLYFCLILLLGFIISHAVINLLKSFMPTAKLNEMSIFDQAQLEKPAHTTLFSGL